MIIAVGGWRGLGATTLATFLAHELAAVHGVGWLIEADPAGGALAGRFEFPGHTVGGLERVAFPAERTTAANAFESVAAAVGPLRIITAPVDPFRAHACHQPRLPWVPSLADLDGPVVVDVGRVRAASPVWPVLHAASVVLMVGAPEVAAAVSTVEWWRAGGRVSAADPGLASGVIRIVIVESHGSVAFSRTAVQSDLGECFGGWLPWEPAAVDLIHRGAQPGDRALRRSTLVGAVRHLARGLMAGPTPDSAPSPAARPATAPAGGVDRGRA